MATNAAPEQETAVAGDRRDAAGHAHIPEPMAVRARLGRVARGGLAAFLVYCAGVGLTYGAQLVIARLAGIESYGVYAYAFAWMVVLAYVSALGFDVVLLRFVSAYRAERAWPLLRGIIEYAQGRVALLGFCIVSAGICLALEGMVSAELRAVFLVGFPLVPILALVRIRCAVVRALGGVVSALAPDRVVRDGILLGLLGGATPLLGWRIDAPAVMLATVIGAVFGLFSTGLALRWHLPLAVRTAAPRYDAQAWRRAAMPVVLIGAAEVFMNRTGIILLGWLVDTKNAGVYSLAFNVALVVTLPAVAVNTLFAPEIARLHVGNERALMQLLVTRAALWTRCAGACVAVILFFLAEPLLAWFGAGYDIGVPALRILLVSQTLAITTGSQLYVMMMTGREGRAAMLLICSAGINVLLSAALIVLLGLTGAAIATGATLCVWNATMAIALWRDLQLRPGALAMRWACAGWPMRMRATTSGEGQEERSCDR